MVSSALKELLGSLSNNFFETRQATGRRFQLFLARCDLNQSVGKLLIKQFKLNAKDKRSVTSARKKNSQLPAAVRVSKTSVFKLSIV